MWWTSSRKLAVLSSLVLPLAAHSGEPPRIEVQGHRGARARFPENTLPAFEHALQVGVDTLELDLGVTKDNALVILHDQSINPEHCLNEDGSRMAKPVALRTLSLSEVKKFDCGTLKHPQFPRQTPVPGTRLSTLDELFEFVKSSKLPAAARVGFNVETKISPDHPELSPAPAEFARLVLEAIKRHGMFERVVIQSFDYRTLTEARRLEPTMRISLLDQNPLANQVALAKKYRADVLSPRQDLAHARRTRELQMMNVRVIPWTANTPKDWDRLIELKVDGIISDDPEALIEHLKAKGLR